MLARVDDLDGSPNATPVRVFIDGRTYSFDLGPANRKKVLKLLAPYIEAAERSESSAQAGGGPRSVLMGQPPSVRDWAIANGYTASRRGRISDEIHALYRQWLEEQGHLKWSGLPGDVGVQ